MTPDHADLLACALELRERYPDDDDFAAAMARLEALLHQEEADAHDAGDAGDAGGTPPPEDET